MRTIGLLGLRRGEGGIDEELASHIAMDVEDGVRAGLSREEARRRALIRLGGAEQTRQAYRERRTVPWMERLEQDARFGLRVLRSSPGFTGTAVLTLALGIGAATAIFSVVKAVLMAPLPYRDLSRLVVVWTASPARGNDPLPDSPGDFLAWKQRAGVFEDLAPSYDSEMTLTGQGSPQFLMGYSVSANYLRILGVQPEIGRLYTDAEDIPKGRNLVLLSDALWRTRFGADAGILGRPITLDGKAFTVLGVMPHGFNYPTETEVWMPLQFDPGAYDDYAHTYIRAIGRVRSGITIAQAEKTLNAVEAQLATEHPDNDAGNHVVLVPLREQLDGDIRRPLLILMGGVGLLLLIACANTASLALARNAERQREIALRLALGATRFRLLRQFATENMMLAAAGGALGLGLASLGSRYLLALFPNDVANLSIPRLTAIPMDRGVFLFAVAITLATSFFFGMAPVLNATRTGADGALHESARAGASSRRSGRSRSAMVVAEISLSLLLLTVAGLLTASLRNAVRANLGFRSDHVFALEVLLPSDRYPFPEQTRTRALVAETVKRLAQLPGVESAGATNTLPLTGFWGVTQYLKRGQAPAKNVQPPEADDRSITPDYLRTMRIPIVRGRGITDADTMNAQHVILINETLAHLEFGERDPVGEELNLGTPEKPEWWQIVGVAGDVKAFGQDQPTHADIYRSFEQHPRPLIGFAIRTSNDPGAYLKSAEQALWSVDPALPVFKAIPMETLEAQSLAVRRSSSILMMGFAALALVLASIGVYGVIAYATTRRTREIGVRMALGARRLDVMWMTLGSGLRLTAIGVGLGLAGSLAASRLLAGLLFEMKPADPAIFSIAAVVLAAAAMLASFLPARRAASVDPIKALRTE